MGKWSKLDTALTRDVITTGPITALRDGLKDKGREDSLAEDIPQIKERSRRY